MKKYLIRLGTLFMMSGIVVLLFKPRFADFYLRGKDNDAPSVDTLVAAQIEKYTLIPFEDGNLTQPSAVSVFIEPDGALFVFEADFGPPENFRTVILRYSFQAKDINKIDLVDSRLNFTCRGNKKCVTVERQIDLSMPIERFFVDPPLQVDRLSLFLTPGAQAIHQKIKEALLHSFSSVGGQLSR